MTPERAAVLLAAHALSRDAQVSLSLRTVSSPAARSAAALLDAGQLEGGLLRLGFDPALGRLGARWPRALGPALRRFDQLPAVKHARVHLATTLGYLGLVLSVQFIVSGLLTLKVFPVFAKMGEHAPPIAFAELSMLASRAVVLLLFPIIGWVALVAAGWTGLPGWGRHFARAKEAAQAAALVESGAPEDVRADAQRGFSQLRSPSATAAELDEVFLEARLDAERSLQRFLVTVRVVGFTLVTVLALALLLAVYSTVARLAWLG